MSKARNSLAVGSALMAAAMLFTGPFESPGGTPRLVGYVDQGGVPTICNGITGPDIRVGMRVTEEWCRARFERELAAHSKPLDRVPFQMTDGARIGWADFLYNLGVGIASDTTTPWRRLMAGAVAGSCDAFLMYRWTRVGKEKRDCSLKESGCGGIWIRRNKERDVCQGRISVDQFKREAEGLPRGGELP